MIAMRLNVYNNRVKSRLTKLPNVSNQIVNFKINNVKQNNNNCHISAFV